MTRRGKAAELKYCTFNLFYMYFSQRRWMSGSWHELLTLAIFPPSPLATASSKAFFQ